MKQPFFSIVIPVYNAAQFLKRTVNSIRAQSFQDYELLLLDDASSDNSLAVARRLAEVDARIRVVSLEENKGVSAVRNQGIQEANGKYLYFMDADDYLQGELLQPIFEAVQKSAVDVVVFGATENYYNKQGKLFFQNEIHPLPGIYLSREALRPHILTLEEQTLYGYPWNKCYLCETLRKSGVAFAPYALNEDLVFNVAYFSDISSMIVLDNIAYQYEKRDAGSLTSKFVPEYFTLHELRIQLLYSQYESWKLLDTSVCMRLANLYLRYILSTLERNADKRAKLSHKARKHWLLDLYETVLYKKLSPYFTPKSRLLRIAAHALQKKRSHFLLIIGRIIHLVKHKSPKAFTTLKQNRA